MRACVRAVRACVRGACVCVCGGGGGGEDRKKADSSVFLMIVPQGKDQKKCRNYMCVVFSIATITLKASVYITV